MIIYTPCQLNLEVPEDVVCLQFDDEDDASRFLDWWDQRGAKEAFIEWSHRVDELNEEGLSRMAESIRFDKSAPGK